MHCPICNTKNINYIDIHPTFANIKVYECKKCKFGFTHPIVTERQLDAFYKSGYYNKVDNQKFEAELNLNYNSILADYIPNYRALSQFNFIYPFLKNSHNKKALEIGCSDGSLLVLLAENGFCVRGYEPDYKMAILANKRLENENNIVFPRIINTEDWKKNYFDLICSSHVLEHISNPIQHLKNIKKSLTKNGFLFLEVPNEYSLDVSRVIDQNINPNTRNQGHLYYYSPGSLEKMLKHCGFKVLAMKTCGRNIINYLPLQHHKNSFVFRKKINNKIKNKVYKLLELFAQDLFTKQSNELFENYHNYPQQGVWIRVLASHQS